MKMENKNTLAEFAAAAAKYCSLLENAEQFETDEVVGQLELLLPRIYYNISVLASEEEQEEFYEPVPDYLDEQYYDSIRRKLEMLFGEDDAYLETFEEDMKYSDTPIGASVSESLADIFQPLYNFLIESRESGGERMKDAFMQCRSDFEAYWSQTLCNVMRPLNKLRYK